MSTQALQSTGYLQSTASRTPYPTVPLRSGTILTDLTRPTPLKVKIPGDRTCVVSCGSANRTSSVLKYLNHSSSSPATWSSTQLPAEPRQTPLWGGGKRRAAVQGSDPSILGYYGTVCIVSVPSYIA